MAEISLDGSTSDLELNRVQKLQKPALILLTLVAMGLTFSLLTVFQSLTLEDELLVESTVGQLAIWMTDQTENDPEEIVSPLAQYADDWANELGEEELPPDILLTAMQNGVVLWLMLVLVMLGVGLIAIVLRPTWVRAVFFVALIVFDGMLFIIPCCGRISCTLASVDCESCCCWLCFSCHREEFRGCWAFLLHYPC